MAAPAAAPLLALFSTTNEARGWRETLARASDVAGRLQGKFQETEAALRTLCGPRLRLLRCEVEPDELQGSCSAIAVAKTREALALARVANAELLSQASFFFTEDVSLHLGCLGGFPGPYVKDFLEAVGEEGVWDCVKRFDDHSAFSLCSLAVVDLRCTPVRDPVVYTGRLDGTIVSPRGDVRHARKAILELVVPSYGLRDDFRRDELRGAGDDEPQAPRPPGRCRSSL
jgi:inosine triphosphate pyrophosphatase